ncbi:hypothetical protein O5166_25880, partial [Escherichia coli]|nr:hypothetical protein [Escherichia coli]
MVAIGVILLLLLMIRFKMNGFIALLPLRWLRIKPANRCSRV